MLSCFFAKSLISRTRFMVMLDLVNCQGRQNIVFISHRNSAYDDLRSLRAVCGWIRPGDAGHEKWLLTYRVRKRSIEQKILNESKTGRSAKPL